MSKIMGGGDANTDEDRWCTVFSEEMSKIMDGGDVNTDEDRWYHLLHTQGPPRRLLTRRQSFRVPERGSDHRNRRRHL